MPKFLQKKPTSDTSGPFSQNICKQTLFIILISCSGAFGQTITSFTPEFGPSGSIVTISGNGFDITPENNTVYFGGAQAHVTSVTTTSLIVTVPSGATYAPITVTTGGLTAYSVKPFTITFPEGGEINNTSFEAKFDIVLNSSTEANLFFVGLADMDRDGKLDILATMQNQLIVLRNVSTAGSLDAGSFAEPKAYATGLSGTGIAIGDMDGDGWLDVAVSNAGTNTVSIFRNTSVNGDIQFDTRVDLTYGTAPTDNSNPWFVAIRDLEGDGKPDIAVCSYTYGKMSVFRNLSSPGVLSGSSFSTYTDFEGGQQAQHLVVEDLDGDTKPDMATFSSLNQLIMVKNTSSPGLIDQTSFASKVEFASGIGSGGLAVVDINGDGKPEIAKCNSNPISNTMSVYQNVSVPGSLNTSLFLERIDIPLGNGPRYVAVNDFNGDGKPDFVITNNESNTISILENKCDTETISATSFGQKVDLQTGRFPQHVAAGDLDGDGKPDIVVSNHQDNSLSIYRNKAGIDYVVTDIPETSSTEIILSFPNPAQTYITLQGVSEKVSKALVIDMNGRSSRLILERYENQTRANISNLTPGTYIMSLVVRSKVHRFKFIKQ